MVFRLLRCLYNMLKCAGHAKTYLRGLPSCRATTLNDEGVNLMMAGKAGQPTGHKQRIGGNIDAQTTMRPVSPTAAAVRGAYCRTFRESINDGDGHRHLSLLLSLSLSLFISSGL